MAMDRIEVITSVERRRRWSVADKARLVAAMDEPDAVVSEIARSACVETSLLYRWRRQFATERTPPTFVSVRVEPERSEAPLSTPPASIAISIGEQVRVTIEGAPDATTLANVIGALTAGGRWR